MRAIDYISDRATYLGFSVYSTGGRPVIYVLLDGKYSEIFAGTYKETLAFLEGVQYEYRLYEG